MTEDKINSILTGCSLNDLAKERDKLTQIYRNSNATSPIPSLKSDSQRLAYVLARMPATCAAVYQVLKELTKRCPETQVSSLLDVGAGPGTALLAAVEAELPLVAATLLERDPHFIAIGKRLTKDFSKIKQEWICQDLNHPWTLPSHDLVLASYSLNELAEKERLLLVEKLWSLTGKFLVIVEPGTKVAFESIKKMRQKLISMGGHLVAPCPHANSCPLPKEDWCHFSVRVERSSFHRQMKDATLNYEDEKYSYLIFSKTQAPTCKSRILRHPFKGKGFVKLQLCSTEGLEQKTVTKKDKIKYLQTKKREWGDEFY
jgi:ribosomal protein RSM22 (predicted rRNA methylase)